MTRFKQISPVESGAVIQGAMSLILEVIKDSGAFRSEWIRQHDWIVVPVESADHFCETDIKVLSAAFRKVGHLELLAVATESLENLPICYKVPTTEEGFREINEATRNYFCILMPSDRSCAVLCTKTDFYLVGGKLPFVMLALETSIPAARAAFVTFSENNPHDAMRKGLLETAARYDKTGPAGLSASSILQKLIKPSSSEIL